MREPGDPTLMDVLVIGAGISGLATAWFLRQRGCRVRVIEASAQAGGCIRTLARDGFLVEAGPNSTLARGGAFDELVRDVGLAPSMLEATRAARRRYVVRDGVPLALPGSPPAFLRTPLFSARAKLRLLAEPLFGRAKNEESVAQFVRRRLGSEFLDWAVDPFVSGVYAGDPERLSVRAATARIHALEAEHGSLIVGAIARAMRGRASGPQPVGRLVSFTDGMAALPRAVAAALGPGAVALGRSARHLWRASDGRWRVQAADQTIEASHVVLAAGAAQAAELLEPLAADAAAALREIAYPPIASVALGFERAEVGHALDGFGMLIPGREGRRTLGALFSSTLFAGRAPPGRVLLTAFIGGARNPGVAALDDAAVIRQVLEDLRPLLGIRGEPVFAEVSRWPRAIPQYELGHLERVARVDRALVALPGLATRANWRDGISVADCVANAHRFVASFA